MRALAVVLTILCLVLSLLLSGCTGVRSSYILTIQYTNSNTNGVERVDVPVTQYEYDTAAINSAYTLSIHTTIFGVRVPYTPSTQTRLAYIEVLPGILLASPVVVVILGVVRKTKWKYIIISTVLSLAIVIGMISTTAAPFDTTGTVVNKDFIISG
jgi:hypothetical protein